MMRQGQGMTGGVTGEGDLALDQVERFLSDQIAGFRGPLAAERFDPRPATDNLS